jgi:Protein of unknown function (DUF3168)
MTASTGWSLQRGIYHALANSSELGALLGGTRIYDDPPQAASYPFISLGQSLLEHRHGRRGGASLDPACVVARRW